MITGASPGFTGEDQDMAEIDRILVGAIPIAEPAPERMPAAQR
jgi:hypothetical protein